MYQSEKTPKGVAPTAAPTSAAYIPHEDAGASSGVRHSYALGTHNENESHIDPKRAMGKPKSRFAVKNQLLRECMAEFLAAVVVILFGDGVVAQVVLADGEKGAYVNLSICWGFAFMFGIYACGGVSGGHINPAVSIALATFNEFEWYKVPFYTVSHVLGYWFGALIVFCVYYPLLNVYDPGRTIDSASVFVTLPSSWESTGGAFVSEAVATAILLGLVLALSDEQNQPASRFTKPIAIGCLITALVMAFGGNTGPAMNPARDLGPRILIAMAGWGADAFAYNDYYFWVPIVAPIVGGIVGVGFYQFLVGIHHPVEETEECYFE